MDRDTKKRIGYLLLALLGGISWYLADLIPTLMLSGRTIALIIIITSAITNFIDYLIKKYTGIPIEEDDPLEKEN